MSNQFKFLILYGISGFLLWCFILPSYNGSGYNLLQVEDLVKKTENQKKAEDLKQKAEDSLKDAKVFSSQYAEFKQDDDKKLSTAMPSYYDPVRLLNEITSLSESSGVSVGSVTYDTNSFENNKDKIYASLNVNIQYAANYDKTYFFIEKLQQNLRLLNIQSISVSSSKNGVAMTGSITASAYYFKPNINTKSTSNKDKSNDLDSIVNSYVFQEVEAISTLKKLIGDDIKINNLISNLVDTSILIEAQKVTQRSNPFIIKF